MHCASYLVDMHWKCLSAQHTFSWRSKKNIFFLVDKSIFSGAVVHQRLRPDYTDANDAPDIDRSGPKVKKHFSCSTQLSMKFSLLINMKMPTI